MKTILALMLVSQLALAQDPPADAPKNEARPAIVLTAGMPAPFDGVLLDDQRAQAEGKRIAKCEAEVADAKQYTLLPVPAVVAIIVGVFVVGAAAGAGITVAATQKK